MNESNIHPLNWACSLKFARVCIGMFEPDHPTCSDIPLFWDGDSFSERSGDAMLYAIEETVRQDLKKIRAAYEGVT